MFAGYIVQFCGALMQKVRLVLLLYRVAVLHGRVRLTVACVGTQVSLLSATPSMDGGYARVAEDAAVAAALMRSAPLPPIEASRTAVSARGVGRAVVVTPGGALGRAERVGNGVSFVGGSERVHSRRVPRHRNCEQGAGSARGV